MPDKLARNVNTIILYQTYMYECWLIVFLLLSFKQGLKTLGVLEKIQTYPEAFCSVLCHKPGNLSAKAI